MIVQDIDEVSGAKTAEIFFDRTPSGPALAAVINGFLSRNLFVYVPGWPGVLTATERTGNSYQQPWVALTDEGGIFVDPLTRTVEDSFGVTYAWPTTLTTIEPVQINENGESVPVNDDDDAPEPEGLVLPASWPWIAGGLAAILFLR